MWIIPSVATSRQSIGNWEATNQSDARFDWMLPANASSAGLTGKLMLIPGVSQTVNCTLSLSVAANAEGQNANTITNSTIAQNVAGTANNVQEIDISALFTQFATTYGFSPGRDYLGLDVTCVNPQGQKVGLALLGPQVHLVGQVQQVHKAQPAPKVLPEPLVSAAQLA